MKIILQINSLTLSKLFRLALLLGACCLGSGIVAVKMGKDVNWDLLNYHYYNLYALFHGRIGWDIAPAQIQTYINPFFDLPFYFFVNTFSAPKWVMFALGALHGVTVFLLVQLTWFFFQDYSTGYRLIYSVAALSVGLTGASGLPVLGSTMVAWQPAGLFLGAVILLLTCDYQKCSFRRRAVHYVSAGILMGIAVGGKLTMAPYAVGMVFAMVLYRGIRTKQILLALLFCTAAGAGIIIGTGYWSFLMYKHFESPLFPFYNDLFQSPYWEATRFADKRFLPRDFYQWIFYPFYWIKTNYGLVTEIPFRDIRMAVIFSLFFFVFGYQIIKWANGEPWGERKNNKQHCFIFLMFAVSYVIWEFMFSIYRYIFPLELISGLILFILLDQILIRKIWKILSVSLISLVVITTTIYPNWGRRAFGDTYFSINVPDLPQDALVVIAGGAPMAFVIPLMNPNVRVISIANNFLAPDQNNLLARKNRIIIAEHEGPIFSMSPKGDDQTVDQTYRVYHLKRNQTDCQIIQPTFYGEEIKICPLLPISNHE